MGRSMDSDVVMTDFADRKPRLLKQDVEQSVARMKRDGIPMPVGGYVVACSPRAYQKLRGQRIANVQLVPPPKTDGRECSMCDRPATHRVKDAPDLLCGKHREWSEKRGIATSQLW